MKMYRQGDILIIRQEQDIPRGIGTRRLNHKILAKGEQTGHSHRLVGNAVLFDVLLSSGHDLFFEAEEEVQLVHEEHETITLPSGQYRVIRQREYDGQNWRAIQD